MKETKGTNPAGGHCGHRPGGFHTATTDKIAAAAGVAVGTIYNYFKNKEDILNHIFQVEYEKGPLSLPGCRSRISIPWRRSKRF